MIIPEHQNPKPGEIVRATLAATVVAVSFYLAYYFRQVLLVFLLALILATAVRPLIEKVLAKIQPRSRAVMIVYAVLLTLILSLLAFTIPLLVEQISSLVAELPGLYEDVRLWLTRASERGFVYLAYQLPSSDQIFTSLSVQPAGANGVATGLLSAGSSMLTALFGTLAVFLLAAFWSLEGDTFLSAIEGRLNRERRATFQRIIQEFNQNIGLFVRAQTILCLSVGALSFVAYLIIGLPNPFALAVIAGILEAVPIVGPTLGAIPAALVAFPMGTAALIGVLVASIVIQVLENNLLVPRVMSESVGVHPILTLLSLVTLTTLLGIPGGILAIPFASGVQVLFRQVRTNIDRETGEGRPGPNERLQAETRDLLNDVRSALPGSPQGEDLSFGFDLERTLIRLNHYLRGQNDGGEKP